MPHTSERASTVQHLPAYQRDDEHQQPVLGVQPRARPNYAQLLVHQAKVSWLQEEAIVSILVTNQNNFIWVFRNANEDTG